MCPTGGAEIQARTFFQQQQQCLKAQEGAKVKPGSPAAPFIAEFLQNKTINELDPPVLVWFKKPSESSRLRQIHEDHTVYCSGEVYSNTFKMIKSSH